MATAYPTTRSCPPDASGRRELAALHRAEDRHFWFRARNRVLRRVFARLVRPLPPGYRVLEVGCGSGNVLRVLEQVCRNGRVVGTDLNGERLRVAARRTRCPLVRADLHRLPFGDPFDLIGLFDVLEHLPDDGRALRDLGAALRPGGALVLTVPAHRRLWSYADTNAGHCRRYSTSGLERVLIRHGFRVEYLTQFMLPLYPLMWLGRRLASVRYRPGHSADGDRARFARELRVVPVLNAALTWALGLEALPIGWRWRLPLGTSLLAVARRA